MRLKQCHYNKQRYQDRNTFEVRWRIRLHVLDINSYHGFEGNVVFGILLKHRGACVLARAHPYRLVPTYGSFTT